MIDNSHVSRRGKSALFSSAGIAALSLAILATPAFAQDAGQADEGGDEVATEQGEEGAPRANIIVSGSRIARPTLASPVPLTALTAEELTSQGDVSLGDALNDLPSLRNTFSQGNSTRFIGTAGLNLLDLRGLGTSRTLVLVNGKRHITADPGNYLVDVNTIPTDLLERVDIVTGGNSAIYGSDAVAGVVNFILKRDFEGISVRGQSGISSRSDRFSAFVAGVYGKNFADGRGNIAVAVEYAKQDPLFFNQRDGLTGAFSGRTQFNVAEPTAGEPFGTDGITDNELFSGIFNGNIADGGLISVNASSNPLSGVFCGNLSEPNRTLRCLPNNQPRIFTFAPDGRSLIESVPTVDFRPFGSGNVIPENPGTLSSLRNTGQLAAGLERYTINILSHFDVSEAFRPFIEAKFVHVDSVQEGQPSFFQGGLLGTFSCSNPFLTPTAITQLQSLGRCAAPTNSFAISRFNVDFGGRGELHNRDTYRIVGGVEGTFNDDWSYEVYANYGRLETNMRSLNNLLLFDIDGNFDGYLLAKNAALAPVGFTGTNFALNHAGQRVVCAINADADPTNDRTDCVPLNVFGLGNSDPNALAFSNTTALRKQTAEQLNFGFSLSGDSSQLFELPGGPIGFALGGEYRSETAFSAFDDLTASGGTFLNAIQPFAPPKLTVKEVFGEINLPIVTDVPFVQELSLGAAGRISDYNGSAGTVEAWNVQGVWAPISDLRFRAALARSVRAPTQDDLFASLSQNFAFVSDPCDVAFITNNPNRAANCADAGVPAGFINASARSQSQSFQSGGNPNLTVEKGKSFTLGLVYEPSYISGLNFTIDYYNIEVNRLISTPSLQQILNLCFDSTTAFANNPFCSVTPDNVPGLFPRNADGTFGDFVGNSVGVNFAGQKTEGIDFDAQYSRTFENGHRLRLRAIATYLITLNDFANAIDPELPDRRRGELGDPKLAASVNFNYDIGALDLNWSVRYLGRVLRSAFENQNSFIGRCPASGLTGFTQGTCTPGELTRLDPLNNDQFEDPLFKRQTYHNVRLNWDIPETEFSFYLGVDNVFDNKPPAGQLGTAGGEPFETFGAFYYVGFSADF